MESKLSNREIRRYNKHLLIPGIGFEGQEKIKNSRILVVGAGGLGCPAMQYLSAAGVGKISILDYGIVDETNLSRQALYGANDLGKLKSIIAKSRLDYLNPLCEYTVINKKLDKTSSTDIISGYDIVIDATDDEETRYVIDDACVSAGIPMIHGAIYNYESIISVFNYMGGPSYRQFNPQSFKEFLNPHVDKIGFFGVLPGITGIYIANEAIKIITGSGEVLSGKILLMNVFNNTFTTLTLDERSGEPRVDKYEDILATV